MSFIRANGAVVHYRDEGPRDGRSIVFINALGSDLRIWDEVAALLAPDFRVVRYDKRGHGLSEAVPGAADMSDYARDLADLLDALGVAQATIVGLSIGGLIAQELYRRSPRLFTSLVLSDTAAKIGDDASWDARIAAIEAGGVEAVADGVLQRWFTADFRVRRPDEVVGWRTMLVRTPKQGYLAACGALKRADLRPYAGAIAVPTLCLARRRGRFDAGRSGARDRGRLFGARASKSSPGPGIFPQSKSPKRPPDLLTRHALQSPAP